MENGSEMQDDGLTVAQFGTPLPRRSWLARMLTGLFSSGLLLAGQGCQPEPAEKESTATAPIAPPTLQGVTLQVLVVDDTRLAAFIERLQGEWQTRTGGDLAVRTAAHTDLDDAATAIQGADVVIYPSRKLGTLAEQLLLVEIPRLILQGEDLAWQDIFEQLSLHEVVWRGETLAAPLGSPVLVVAYRADLLKLLDRKPPRTWQEYHELAALLADPAELGLPAETPWQAVQEPWAAGSAATTLLARAAAYAKHPDNFSAFFDIDSMEPLIAGPGFVRALTEMVALRQELKAKGAALNVQQARQAFWNGECGLALTWSVPPSAGEKLSRPPGDDAAVGFVELPGAPQAWNPSTKKWERRERGSSTRMPLIGSAGLIGSVVRGSSHQQGAVHLLAWLAGKEWSARVATAGDHAAPFRKEHLIRPQDWIGAQATSAEAHRYVDAVAQSLSSLDGLLVLRIPGEARYMAVLDEQVVRALNEEVTPQGALDATAHRWREITNELGLEAQRDAYQHSLGME